MTNVTATNVPTTPPAPPSAPQKPPVLALSDVAHGKPQSTETAAQKLTRKARIRARRTAHAAGAPAVK